MKHFLFNKLLKQYFIKPFVTLMLVCYCKSIKAQTSNANLGVTLDAKITLGNQNNLLKLGVSVFGAANYKNLAIEGGLSFYTGYTLQRHSINQAGLIYGYDAFYLLGYGKNNNLLGSSLSQYNSSILFNEELNNEFYGVGFGFEKQYLPKSLKEFNQRIGRLIMRYSTNNTSVGFTFKNDLKVGGLFYGDATDFGATGSLLLNYTNASNTNRIHDIGFVIDLFTPKQDYNLIPNNKVNSDDGRKNVWYTTGNYKNNFLGNTYLKYKLQNHNVVYQIKAGMESNQLGAYIQNKLHDSFGLNPRFPWNVKKKNALYIQGEVQTFINNL